MQQGEDVLLRGKLAYCMSVCDSGLAGEGEVLGRVLDFLGVVGRWQTESFSLHDIL